MLQSGETRLDKAHVFSLRAHSLVKDDIVVYRQTYRMKDFE